MILRVGRLAWGAFRRFLEHDGPDRAAAVSYYTLLSLLPLFILLVSLGIALLGSFDSAYSEILILLQGVMAPLNPASKEALRQFVEGAARFHWPGLLLLAFTTRRVFGSLLAALERVFEVTSRGLARDLIALAMVIVTGVGLLITMFLSLLVSALEGAVTRLAGPAGTQAFGHVTGFLLPHAAPALTAFGFFFIIYHVVPRSGVTTADAARGAALATVLWEVAKAALSYYVRDVARYASVYGALEGIIVLALWLEVSVSIILYCGEIVALSRGTLPGAPP